MATPDLLAQLREVEFLQGSAEDLLEKIAEMSRMVDFPSGAVIFREGEPATKVYLVTSGNVSIEICAPGVGCRRILTIGDGELLAWSAMLGQSQLTATARALADTTAIEVNAGQLLAICEHNSRFGYELMLRAANALSKRLDATRLQLVDVYGSQMPDSSS